MRARLFFINSYSLCACPVSHKSVCRVLRTDWLLSRGSVKHSLLNAPFHIDRRLWAKLELLCCSRFPEEERPSPCAVPSLQFCVSSVCLRLLPVLRLQLLRRFESPLALF